MATPIGSTSEQQDIIRRLMKVGFSHRQARALWALDYSDDAITTTMGGKEHVHAFSRRQVLALKTAADAVSGHMSILLKGGFTRPQAQLLIAEVL